MNFERLELLRSPLNYSNEIDIIIGLQGGDYIFIPFGCPIFWYMVHLTIKFIKHQIFYDFLPIIPDNLMKIKQSWPQPQPQEQKEVKFKIYTTLPFSCNGQQHWERQCFSFIDSTQITFLNFTICMYQFDKICFWQKNPYNKKL